MLYKDLAYGIVLTAPSPTTSGTSLVLNSGQGAYFPQPSTDGNFYITIFPINADPTFSTAEICLVTARSTDTLTIVRIQKGTSARTVLVGDRVIQGIYASDIVGVNPAVAVQVATTAAGDTSSLTYNNGVAGVGATFTGSVNTALTFDGQTLTSVGQRVLVKNDTQSPSGAFNGVYSLTQVQTVALPPILTRATDYNMTTDINNTGAIPVVLGTANAQTTWVLTSTVTTIGTDALTFTQFSLKPSTIVTLTGSQALSNKTYEGYSINATPTANNIPVLDANANLPYRDGWTPATGTWTYASASTITVPSGAASLYQKGDRIKWTQTTVKYGVIVAVADTLLTIAVNTDYTVTNAAITLNYYSHQANPLGYPGWFTFTPTYTGFSANPGNIRYFIIGSMVTIDTTSAGNGTSNATGFTMSLPVAINASVTNMFPVGLAYDNGGYIAPVGSGNSYGGQASITWYKGNYGTGWTASGSKGYYINFTYQF